MQTRSNKKIKSNQTIEIMIPTQSGLKHRQTDFSKAFEGGCNGSFVILVSSCFVGSLCSICSIPRCERLEGAQYHAGNLVIVMKTAMFVFAIVGRSKLPIDMPGDYAPCVVNLGDYGIAQQQAGNLQNLMGGDILAWQPSSAVRIGPFILCRSGWHVDLVLQYLGWLCNLLEL